jgi:hypothetical protein
LLLINQFLLIKKKYVIFFAILFALMAIGAYKLEAYSITIQEDFDGLHMNGKYTVLDGYAGPAIYSVLAYKGFYGDFGSLDPAAPQNVVNDYLKLNKTDCKALSEYSKKTGVKYFITNQADLERCGFKLVWKSEKETYGYGPLLIPKPNDALVGSKLRAYEKIG